MAFTGPAEDRLGIRERIDAYGDAVNCRDVEAWTACWAEDAAWNLMGAEILGRPAIRAAWLEAMAGFAFVSFRSSPGAIEITGDRARVRVHTEEVLVAAGGAPRRVLGLYDDELARRDGGWLFARRAYRVVRVDPAAVAAHRVTIAGEIDLADASVRERTLLAAQPLIARALAERGCVHYAWTADPARPGRVHVFEEWASEADLAAHLAAAPYRDMLAHLGAAGIAKAVTRKYRVDLVEPVYDDTGLPRADFVTAA